MNRILGLVGLAKKGGRLEVGEEPVAAAARAKDARLLLLAADAADNSARRLRHFAEAGGCLYARLPCTKAELGRAVGRTSCAMAAVTDIGFASAIGALLAAEDEERFAELAAALAVKERRARERRIEQERHEKNVRMGRRKPAPAAQEPPPAQEKKPPKPAAAHAPRDRAAQRREHAKREAAQRYAHARPVKKGKGSTHKKP